MNYELLEILRELEADGAIDLFDGKPDLCKVCKKIKTTNHILDNDEEIDIPICDDCAVLIDDPKLVIMNKCKRLHTEWLEENPRALQPEGETTHLEDIASFYPQFFNCCEEFADGHFTLDDGTEDEMLASIYQFVFVKEKIPTEKQMKAFQGRCDVYLTKKREGLALKDPVKARESGSMAKDLITSLNDYKSEFSESSREYEVITSFTKFFEDKGYLTEKQFNYAKSILKKVKF